MSRQPEFDQAEILARAERAAEGGPFPADPLETPLVMEKGTHAGFAKPEVNRNFRVPAPPAVDPEARDWALPPERLEEALAILKEKVDSSRTLRLFLENCQHCGACADKCPFYIGSGDPLNMPVMRAELIRAVWKGHFTLAGKILAGAVGAKKLTPEILRKWWLYFFQCSACRRCAVFCPLGIDTAEFTALGREILFRLGLSNDWSSTPAWTSHVTGNHLGLKPKTLVENIEFLCDEIKEYTGRDIRPRLNRKGAEILFIFPSADVYAEPGIFTFMGYLLFFEYLGLDYTLSTLAAEAGNFGVYLSPDVARMLAGKYYQEAERLKVKWLLGGECGVMTRIMNQQLATMWAPPNSLETPVNPATGTVFTQAADTRMIHILELMADSIRHRKLKLDPGRNAHLRLTYHDSCNTARGLGLLEEPRLILRAVADHFYEMDAGCIRENTLCCGGGGGLNGGEYMKTRLMGGLARARAVAKVRRQHGVNAIACNCAVDRAVLPALMDFWTKGVTVYGLSELLGQALLWPDEPERLTDLRGQELPRTGRNSKSLEP